MLKVILYFDPEAYADEGGEPLTDERLHEMGHLLNDEVASFYLGYSGWRIERENGEVIETDCAKPTCIPLPTKEG
jgi:hypothetical protein